MKEKQAMQEQQLTAMEEPVRMMLLDAIFTDAPASAPATPPSVRRIFLSLPLTSPAFAG
jgi:hypothetical protein